MKNLNFEGKTIFLGLDVHKRSWDLQVLTENTTQKQVHFRPGSVERLYAYIKKHYPGGTYWCAYEAGFSGFWIQEQMEGMGIKTLVFNPADIPTTDKEKRFKTDKQDCRKIAKALRGGFLTGIYIPSKAQQMDRSLVRHRYRCVRDQNRIKNRIRSHLIFYGIQIPWDDEVNEKYWSNRMISNIRDWAVHNEHEALYLKTEMLAPLRQAEARAMRQIRKLAKSSSYKDKLDWLVSIRGIGILTAMVILTEMGPIDRFKNLDQLASYVGIIPGSKSSGDTEKNNRISRRGNKHLRTALIQAAWMSLRSDPQMALYYENCRVRMNAQKAIIKVCKKLLNRVRYVLKNHTKLNYEI